MDDGIVLPIHDSFVVHHGYVEDLRSMMQEALQAMFRQDIDLRNVADEYVDQMPTWFPEMNSLEVDDSYGRMIWARSNVLRYLKVSPNFYRPYRKPDRLFRRLAQVFYQSFFCRQLQIGKKFEAAFACVIAGLNGFKMFCI